MSSVDLVTRHARATADACRRVRVPGVARDFVQNGSPAQQNKTSSVDKKKKDHDNKQALVILDEERDEEKDVLRDACMLRASAEVVMSKQQAELQFLEGKIAALENMERQNTTRNRTLSTRLGDETENKRGTNNRKKGNANITNSYPKPAQKHILDQYRTKL